MIIPGILTFFEILKLLALVISVLGKEVISLAKKQGIKTINVVRRNEVINELKELGCVSLVVLVSAPFKVLKQGCNDAQTVRPCWSDACAGRMRSSTARQMTSWPG